MSILCCQKAFQIIQNLQYIFWAWVWSPPPFEQCSKNADLVEGGTPYFEFIQVFWVNPFSSVNNICWTNIILHWRLQQKPLTSIEDTTASLSEVDFPSVTICNLNQVLSHLIPDDMSQSAMSQCHNSQGHNLQSQSGAFWWNVHQLLFRISPALLCLA